jgi:uncharacterized protein YfaS (alpha-2-macroglobulin family)
MKRARKVTPELEMKAESYINLGYQRLLTFEVPGGGFSLYGRPPAELFLSAYGLFQISDMAKVYPVDPALIERTARWLLEEQAPDGSWSTRDLRVGGKTLAATAYVVWSLVEAGYEDTSEVRMGISYIKEFMGEAEDAYELALVANALAAASPGDSMTRKALKRLAEMAIEDDGAYYWKSEMTSFMGAFGKQGSIETTALAAIALIKADAYPELANGALTYLVRSKDSFGTWGSTQATILSLKALILSLREAAERAEATVLVSLNGEEAEPILITPEAFDVVHLVSFEARKGDNMVRISMEGEGNLFYQISTEFYIPWRFVPKEKEEPISIDVSYDRTDLTLNDTVRVDVRVNLNIEGVANMVIVDLGIPPGFEVIVEDLERLVERDLKRPEGYEGVRVKRFELTGRQIILYLEDLTKDFPLEASYRLRAKYPIVAKIPLSRVYDYYNPEVLAVERPEEIVVK